jgi:transcriptional regulator with XRE-family HTH domain
MLSPIKTNLGQKLKDKAYRNRFFRGRVQDEIAFQLREARKKRKLTQPKLEKLSGMKQSAISRIEQASYSRWNFQTLLRIAEALDVRVRITLDYSEDVIREYEQRGKNAPAFERADNTLLGNWTTSIYGAALNNEVAAPIHRDLGDSVTKAAYV